MQSLTVKAWGWVTADTLDFGACLFRCVLMGRLREHSFELKGYLLRTNIIPHFVVNQGSADLRSLGRLLVDLRASVPLRDVPRGEV